MDLFNNKKINDLNKKLDDYRNLSTQEIKKKDSLISRLKSRKFYGAIANNFQNWLSGYQPINRELYADIKTLIDRSRELYKNNSDVKSYVEVMTNNVLGSEGFKLQLLSKDILGNTDVDNNQKIRNQWIKYGHKINGLLTVDKKQGELDFDIAVFQTFLIDGNCFIHSVLDNESDFGIRYEILDTLDLDLNYNSDLSNGEKVIFGIRLDAKNIPISYFFRARKVNQTYQTGERIEIPASDIIHIYRKTFADQILGIPSTSAVMQSLHQLSGYMEAEIIAARMAACSQAFYVKTGNSTNDGLDDEEISNDGYVQTELQPGMIGYAPDGYQIQTFSSNHPNSNFSSFTKVIKRNIAAGLGLSYNLLSADYESVNYSSLRAAALNDRESWKQLQNFIVENWKNYQYQNFLKFLLLNEVVDGLQFRSFDKFLNYKFKSRKWAWVDPQKDLAAVKLKLEMRLSDPISEIENVGNEVDEVLDNWSIWEAKLKQRNLTITTDNVVDIVEEINNEIDESESTNE